MTYLKNYKNRNFKERQELFNLKAIHAQNQIVITCLWINFKATIWKFLRIRKAKFSKSLLSIRNPYCNTSGLITWWEQLYNKIEGSIEKESSAGDTRPPEVSPRRFRSGSLSFPLVRAAMVPRFQVHCGRTQGPARAAFLPLIHNLAFSRKYPGSCKVLKTDQTPKVGICLCSRYVLLILCARLSGLRKGVFAKVRLSGAFWF